MIGTGFAAVVDKTKQRLESLEDEDEDSVQTMLDMSQQDYIKHIDELQQQLIAAWDSDQRVKSLKIAIQVRRALRRLEARPPTGVNQSSAGWGDL